ncbi:DUF6207 family protein [Streptomyces sp. NPDC050388]|uniref:DUF6207 family protein n=1 Tax=Streptomyces sp. NPDC050388 TaxID=3155781 RepID=UPI00344718F6
MITLSTIDDLLAQSLLLDGSHIPPDVVPYDDMAVYALAEDTLWPWEDYGPELADDCAAQSLAALCEAVVARCTAEQLADFLTDQLPQPRAAWILGCVLQLAGATDGARFWWQYAAGADDAPASYCLYLQHLAHGDTHAAALWRAQAGADAHEDRADTTWSDAPAYRMVTADTSIPTVLRILTRLHHAAPRRHTQTATAVIDFVATAVAIGYHRHPDLEIPVPGPDFAEHLEIILAASSPARTGPAAHGSRCSAAPERDATGSLPNRPVPKGPGEGSPGKDGVPEPERLLVEVTGTDHEAPAFFKEAVAVCWAAVTAARTAGSPDGRGTRLAYYLDRFRPRGPRPRTAQAF